MCARFPKYLLDETPWDFAGKPSYPSRSEFEAAMLKHLRDVAEYASDISPHDWRPNEVVLSCRRFTVRYYCDTPGQAACWLETELESDNGISFSAGELFHKLHNAIIGHVRENGHRYFEGLEFDGFAAAGAPVYRLVPGS